MLVSVDLVRRDVATYSGLMSWIDVAIVAVTVVSGLRGWSRGLVRQLGTLIGRMIGFVGGLYLAAAASARVSTVAWRPLVVVLVIVASTVVGGVIVRYFGGAFSHRLREGHLGTLDKLLGAGVGVAGMVVTCWLVGALLAVVPWSTVGQSVNRSVILRYVQRVLPAPPAVESRLQGVLSQWHVPSLFADVVSPVLPAYAPRTLSTRHHVTSPSGVVSVRASGGCHRTNWGTGVVVAPHEVVTAASLVAGERRVVVDGHASRVVLFDPVSDLAVVQSVGLGATPVAVATSSPATSRALVVGFQSPNDRVATGALFLGAVTGAGRDIFSGPVFTRTMDVVVASLTATQDGSPVLVNGAVVAVVAEPVMAHAMLAYAVPLAQLRAGVARVSTATVSTQRCVN